MTATAAGFVSMVPNVVAVTALVSLVAANDLQVRYVEVPHLHRLDASEHDDYAARFVPVIARR